MGSAVVGPTLLVVDCPSEAHVAAVSAPGGPLSKWTEPEGASASTQNGGGGHRLMAHFTTPALMASDPYQAWLARLGAGWTHMAIAPAQSMTLRRATALQVQAWWLFGGWLVVV
jgi:hypothetical protein